MSEHKFGGYTKLQVWQKSTDFVVEMYSCTKKFPKDELYGLVSQIRRSVVSIPSNIAEGQARNSKKEFCHFLRIAYASGAELDTQIVIAEKLGYLSKRETDSLQGILHEIMSMIVGLIKSLNSKQ